MSLSPHPSPIAPVSRWAESPGGPRGGPVGEERLSGLGHGVQRQLGHHGGRGRVPAAGTGFCQPRFPGETSSNHCPRAEASSFPLTVFGFVWQEGMKHTTLQTYFL